MQLHIFYQQNSPFKGHKLKINHNTYQIFESVDPQAPLLIQISDVSHIPSPAFYKVYVNILEDYAPLFVQHWHAQWAQQIQRHLAFLTAETNASLLGSTRTQQHAAYDI